MRVLVALLVAAVGCTSGEHCRTPREGELFPFGAGVTLGGHSFEVEIADEPAEQQQGLMGRTELGPDAGMLFAWSDVAERSFWMKDTLIPLDVVAIADGRIVSVDTMQPCAATPCPSTRTAPAEHAVEIPGGRAAELGLAVGDPARVEAAGCA